MNDKSEAKLIHVGKIQTQGRGNSYLFLRKESPKEFVWYEDNEKRTNVAASTAEEAIRLANKRWNLQNFRTINCGFRYTLPERDEHGMNALFHQMTSSYQTANGVYFDEELGHNCTVQNASQEALDLWKHLTGK